MDEHQKLDKHNQQKICTCKSLIDNGNTFRNNESQWNENSTQDNDSNLDVHVDESTSQNTNSNNGSQNKNVAFNQHVSFIDLSEEDITIDGVVIKEEKQETNNIREIFNTPCGSKMAAHNNEMMAGNVSNNEEINEIQDLSKPTTKKEEAYEVPQKKIETVSDNIPNLYNISKLNEMNKAAIDPLIKYTNPQPLEETPVESSNLNNLKANASDVMKMKSLYDRSHRSQTEAVKCTKDEYTQTDKNNNDKCTQTESQTKPNIRNHRTNNKVIPTQLNSYINQNWVRYEMRGRNPTQQMFSNNQRPFVQEGMNTGHVVTGQGAVTNAAPAMMQAGLFYLYPPPAYYNTSRPAVARYPYTTQYTNRIRSQNGANNYQPIVQYRPQYSQYTATQNSEWVLVNDYQNYQNYQNYHGYQNQYNNL